MDFGSKWSGKTTTIKMITGILPIDEGEITINGFNIERMLLTQRKNMGLF